MFIPNNTGRLSRKIGMTIKAEARFSIPETVDCGVVSLANTDQKTSVRSDSSASRGSAQETVSDAKILFPATVTIIAGDRFEIAGFTLKVITVQPRYSVLGILDHYEVDFAHWGP
ncbi:hypothetical protein SAMN05216548_1148 [Faunimonas pinastri]|uniref:Uncharacterized protein n=1 Tax=Faunimonas pinastri TaxID=1855383 RepID=A0A1H9MS61_9HYPH|nr:hypothetical protein [Faunimonas pinastri]SER25963.1 hypothetical protein SAMN05216548_1148 [Faunimonas pinastri]